MNTTPSTEPQGSPPTGAVAAEATCCPEVSTFEGARAANRVYGFDARTNIVEPGSNDEYWIPPVKSPGDSFKRDGARWCSVPLGQTTDLEISFDGHVGIGCISNCTFRMLPEGIVTVETPKITSNKARFVLRGVAEGETSVQVICQGVEIGWVHVICFPMIQIDVTIGAIKTQRTNIPGYSATGLERALNKTFRQASIQIAVTDVGTFDLTANPFVRATEDSLYGSDGFDPSLSWNGSEVAFLRMLGRFAPTLQGHVPLFYYNPVGDAARYNGSVVKVGDPPGFVFKASNLADSYAVLAHELGHIFQLLHPDMAPAMQIPDHHFNSIGQPVASEPATNTEPAINGNVPMEPTDRALVMALDPLNLMGYWPNFQEQVYLRRLQWVACRAIAQNFRRR